MLLLLRLLHMLVVGPDLGLGCVQAVRMVGGFLALAVGAQHLDLLLGAELLLDRRLDDVDGEVEQVIVGEVGGGRYLAGL